MPLELHTLFCLIQQKVIMTWHKLLKIMGYSGAVVSLFLKESQQFSHWPSKKKHTAADVLQWALAMKWDFPH